jgi:hypothetical protein
MACIYTHTSIGEATLRLRLLPTNLQNNLGYTVWVGILGSNGIGQPDNGGFTLNDGERVSKGQESCGSCTWSAKMEKLH